jgi:hypothetical protein
MRKATGVREADLLDRCLAFEERAAAVYRRFAAARLDDAELAALWTGLAADEDEHARTIRDARDSLAPGQSDLIAVGGCEAACAGVGARLDHAESLDATASPSRQLAAALDIELSEIEALRRLALQASGRHSGPTPDRSHLHRLADTARRRSQDGHVRLAAVLLLARERLTAIAGPASGA